MPHATTPPTPPSAQKIIREEILESGIADMSGSGPLKVLHQIWFNFCPQLLLCVKKDEAQGPSGAQEQSLKFYFIELALGSP